jgi:16S rRNA processing protein RimM
VAVSCIFPWTFCLHEVLGYEVHDIVKGKIGILKEVLDYPGNPVFLVIQGRNEVLIPARDEFIEKLDRKEKILFVKAPEGLIDLYLKG